MKKIPRPRRLRYCWRGRQRSDRGSAARAGARPSRRCSRRSWPRFSAASDTTAPAARERAIATDGVSARSSAPSAPRPSACRGPAWSRTRRQDHRMAVEGAAALSAADEEGRGADRRGLSRRDQHAAGEARAVRPVPGRGRQGRRQPGLAQGEGRLGRVVRPQPRRGGHRPADPRRHGDEARLDRKATNISVLAAIGVRRDGQKILLVDQEHGRREHGGVAPVPRRSRRPRAEGAPTSSSSTAPRASRPRSPRCGARTCRSSAAPCTSIATCSATRRSPCTTS